MPIFLTTLLASVRSIFQSRAALELENLALRHPIAVLRRSAAKRLKLTSADRLLWICLSRFWHDWRSALAIVKPETDLAWHHADFRLFWTWKVRHGQPGRPVNLAHVPGESHQATGFDRLLYGAYDPLPSTLRVSGVGP
jgi:hypothetical protein